MKSTPMKSALTPAQQQQNARIIVWLRTCRHATSTEFPLPGNLSPEPVPDMTLPQALETYAPPNAYGLSQYFTPLATATRILEELRFNFNQPLRVLIPGAGIGHLIWPLLVVRDTALVDAYEIDEECTIVGRGLFPWVVWYNLTPFPHLAVIEEQYDLVLCHPPLGTERGLHPSRIMCAGRANRSEYIFFELCIRALRPAGQAIFLGMEFFMRRMSHPLREWFETRAEHIRTLGPLADPRGDLYAFYCQKKAYLPPLQPRLPQL